jgi:hypothetical protein
MKTVDNLTFNYIKHFQAFFVKSIFFKPTEILHLWLNSNNPLKQLHQRKNV